MVDFAMVVNTREQGPQRDVEANAESVAAIDSAEALDLAAQVRARAKRAEESGGAQRRALAGEINRLLERFPAAFGAERAARELEALLADKTLRGLEGADARTCRQVAVGVLLSLGYPYALEVHPRDLEYYRVRERGLGLRGLAVAVTAAPFIALPVLLEQSSWAVLTQPALFAGVTAGVAAMLVSLAFAVLGKPTQPRARRARWALFTLGLGAIAAVALTLVSFGGALLPLLPSGLAAATGALLLQPTGAAEDD